MSIILVANLDMNDGIGDSNGELLFDIKEDKKFFKQLTSNKKVVMGRKTWDSLPEQFKPLPRRKNFVLTRDKELVLEGAKTVDLDEVINMSKSSDIYIIGGGEIYELFLPYADEMYLTHVHKIHIDAQVFFPTFEYKDWDIVGGLNKKKGKLKDGTDLTYTFTHYVKNK